MRYIIIGAGVMGLLCARSLAHAGHRVLLLEQAQAAGREASWAGAGIGLPLYPWRYKDAVSRLVQRGQQLYPALARALSVETGIDIGFRETGLLILGAEEQEQAVVWANDYQVSLEILSANKVKEIAPNIQAVPALNLWLPNIAQIRNPWLLNALKASILRENTVEVVTNCAVTDFTLQDRRIIAVRTQKGDFSGDHVVVTSGAWTASLFAMLGRELPIFPVRGQILLWQLSKMLLSCIVLTQGYYLVPREDGHLLVGSTVEPVGFDRSITSVAYQELYHRALTVLPSLVDEKIVQHWAGLRPGSVDGIPFIGQVPGIDNAWINAGHYRNGLIMAPAANELLMDLMQGRKPVLEPSLYQLKVTACAS